MTVNAQFYLKQCQRLLREQKQEFTNPEDLLAYINLARREVAGRKQCIRRLTPISGTILSATVLTSGSGYVTPVASITTPDFPSGVLPNPNGLQATATVQILAGTVTGITITNPGDGYFLPQITILDVAGVGTGATAELTESPLTTLNLGQEVYPFSGINLGSQPGVDSVYMLKSVSVIYAYYRYPLPLYSSSP